MPFGFMRGVVIGSLGLMQGLPRLFYEGEKDSVEGHLAPVSPTEEKGKDRAREAGALGIICCGVFLGGEMFLLPLPPHKAPPSSQQGSFYPFLCPLKVFGSWVSFLGVPKWLFVFVGLEMEPTSLSISQCSGLGAWRGRDVTRKFA